jgi:branched-chain amino acid transport system ATP-binding protein
VIAVAPDTGAGGSRRPAGAPVLSARGLRKEFAGFVAVQNVDIDVYDGQIKALIGPNGAGKSTVFNLLTKFLKPTAGKIELLGQDITGLDPAKVARMGLVRSFQISAVFPHLTLLDNVRVALQRPQGLGHQFWLGLTSLDRLNDRAYALLEAVDLADHAHETAADLSYGRKRVLEIATTLALEPRVLLLDEPMAGMGHEDVGQVAALISKVARDCAVLMVEHNLRVVADLCDEIVVLQRGEIIAQGDYQTVSNDPLVREAYMGTTDV